MREILERSGPALLTALVLAASAHATHAHAQGIVEPGGRLVIGYFGDARPFSFENESGKPAGYAVELCEKVVEIAKAEVGLSAERVSWQRVSAENRLTLLRERKVKLLCGEPVTPSARKSVSFSIPIFQGGVGALVRADAEPALVKALERREGLPPSQVFAVVGDTPTEKLLSERLKLAAAVTPVTDYASGVQAVLDRKANAFFADRSILLDAVKRNASFSDLRVIERRFTTVPVAIALSPGNEEARLAVNRTLSRIYATKAFRDVYVNWFGEPDAETLRFFRASVLPE